MEEMKNATILNDEQLKEAAGGVKIAPGTGGVYLCPKCGNDDFVILNVQGDTMYVRCKRCNQIASCSASR